MKTFLVILTLLPSISYANSDSLLTVGFGASVGTQQNYDHDNSAFVEGKVRLRALRGLGLELAYNPLVPHQNGPRYDSSFKMFGLIHIVPTSPVGAYIKFGAGSSNLNVFNDSKSSSYHAGGGLNLYLGDNLAVGLECLMSFPSFENIADNHEQGFDLKRYKFSADVLYYL